MTGHLKVLDYTVHNKHAIERTKWREVTEALLRNFSMRQDKHLCFRINKKFLQSLMSLMNVQGIRQII